VANIRLKFIKAYVDRHGKARHYFRRKGQKPVPLTGAFGSQEFMANYAAALAAAPAPIMIGERRVKAGTIAAMVTGYLQSASYSGLAPISQRSYQWIFERMRKDYGELSISTLKRAHVQRMLASKAATPAAARDFLRCLRLLIRFALDLAIITEDPTTGIKMKVKGGGYRSWTEQEIATFQNTYAVGTKQRLALELLLNTAARCADTVKFGRGHVRNGELHYVQQKTGRAVVITITPELAAAINAAAPSEHVVFLINERGRAYGAAGFSQMFVRWCREAGLKGLSAHGLRKAACRRMAEAGCSAPQIAAVSGHATLEEVQRYIDAADRAKLARAAMNKIRMATSSV
jgi:integrase